MLVGGEVDDAEFVGSGHGLVTVVEADFGVGFG